MTGNEDREVARGQIRQELKVNDEDFDWLNCEGKALEGFEYSDEEVLIRIFPEMGYMATGKERVLLYL